jgi:hypothetical protein
VNTATSVALGLLAVAALALARRVELKQGAGWWRVLLPSWRFFEAPDLHFTLEVRTWDAAGATGALHTLPPRTERSLTSLFYAPEANLALAGHDLVETLVSELAERGAIAFEAAEQLSAYKRVQHMARFFLREQVASAVRYQLKLSSHSPDGSTEELFLSPPYALD